MCNNNNSSPRVMNFNDLVFKPRFEYPEMCEVVEVAGLNDFSELSGGFAKFKDAKIPWQVKYDEIVLVLRGFFTVETPSGSFSAGPLGTIWLPKGTEVTYIAEDALVFYSLQPASWSKGKEND
ncbi:MAG: hypothetical protein MH208_19705 [Marinobacter sp.]|nr:hypothetical protein [Marinobacter sp.]